MCGEDRRFAPATQAMKALELWRKESKHITFPREEVRGWVTELATLGIVAGEGHGLGRLREGLRQAIQDVIGRLRRQAA